MSKPIYRRLIRDSDIVGYSLEVLIYFDNTTGQWSNTPIKHDRDNSPVLSSPPMMKRPTLKDIFPKRKREYKKLS